MSAYIVSKTHIDALVTAGLVLARPYGPLRWHDGATMPDDTHEPGQPWGPGAAAWWNEHRRELTEETASDVGVMLWTENVRSIHHRYPDTLEGGMYPGPVDFGMADVIGYQHSELPGHPDPVIVLKALDCFEYQACEHPQWTDSEAQRFCDALRRVAIGKVRGYDDADGWDISDRNVFLRAAVAARHTNGPHHGRDRKSVV